MAVIELSLPDLESLLGKKLPRSADGLNDVLQYAKCEVENLEKDSLTVSVEDANRPDLLSTEGVARELRGALNVETGLPRFNIRKSNVTVAVDKKLDGIRKYAACAVVKNVRMTEQILKQLIQLQEKMNGTYGRNRKVVGTGIYDFDRIKPPIRYTVIDPDGVKFSPLGLEESLTPRKILERHPKGVEFGHLISKHKVWPTFIDSRNEILSMPPIINSNYSGKVDSNTRNLFVEATGTAWGPVLAALNITTAALAERGGNVESVTMVYGEKKITTPDFAPSTVKIASEETNKRLGLSLKPAEIETLLKKARYGVKAAGKIMNVEAPAYRVDIMHPVDVIEDIAIQYGYHKFGPVLPALPTIGSLSKGERFSDKVRILLIGLGCQEVLNFTLTNRTDLFRRMQMPEQPVVEVANQISSELNIMRTWLLPGLLNFLSNNRTQDYPQRVFEVGHCVVPDKETAERSKTVRKLAVAIAHDRANLTEMRGLAESVLRNLGLKWEIADLDHPSFIPTRCAQIRINGKSIGFYGEVHPAVLDNWKIEMPVIVFELDLEELMSSIIK